MCIPAATGPQTPRGRDSVAFFKCHAKKWVDLFCLVKVVIQKRNDSCVVHDKAKPSARVGRKAYGSPADSRVAEISRDICGPGFFVGNIRNCEVLRAGEEAAPGAQFVPWSTGCAA